MLTVGPTLFYLATLTVSAGFHSVWSSH